MQPPYGHQGAPPPGPYAPFQPPPVGGPTMDHRQLRAEIAGPAIGLMIGSGLAFLFYLFAVVMVVFAGGMSFLSGSGRDPMGSLIGSVAGGAIYGLFALMALAVFFGALRMKAMKNYGLSLAAAILAIVPCSSYVCCFVVMPFGIWALIVLLKPEVKAAFG